MTILFDSALIEAQSSGDVPTSPGPFSSVTTTNGTVLVSNAQAHSGTVSIKFEATGAGTAFNGLITTIAVPSAYETIYHSFWLYIDTITSTSTVLTLVMQNQRHACYLFNSSGWKIGFTPLHNTTNAKTGNEATSAVITTGAWHHVIAIYQKTGASSVDMILVVDDVRTSTGSQTPSSFTVISGNISSRVGPASQPTWDVNATAGDKLYMDDVKISAFPAPAPEHPAVTRDGRLGSVRRLGIGPMYVG